MINEDPVAAFSEFSSTLNNIFEDSFPLIESKPNKNKNPINPWFISALLVCRKNKEKLFKEKTVKSKSYKYICFQKIQLCLLFFDKNGQSFKNIQKI